MLTPNEIADALSDATMWAITIYYELVDAGWDRMTALQLARYAVEVHNRDTEQLSVRNEAA